MSKIRASAYSQVEPNALSIRDHLARDRTILANERTLLSYVRTGFGFAAAGVTLIKLLPDEPSSQWIGLGLLIGGGLICLVGISRFFVVARQLKRIIQPR